MSDVVTPLNTVTAGFPDPIITISEQSDLVAAVRSAFDNASAGVGNVDEIVLRIGGFCGQKHRLLINNIIATLQNPRYLENGIFAGATFCAAISNNRVFAVGVDNWSEYGGPANAATFYRNLAIARSPRSAVTIIEQDFRVAPLSSFGAFDLGFYDGSHTEQDQYDGARVVLASLKPRGILMVDDWNWRPVRAGTHRALKDTDVNVDLMIELRTTADDSFIGSRGGGTSDWHNGLMVAVVSRGAACPVAPQELAASPRPATPATEAQQSEHNRLRQIATAIESIGRNCEWGAIQREFGAEPISLLRWAGATDRDLLAAALRQGFAGLLDAVTPIYIPNNKPIEEQFYWLVDSKYQIIFHTDERALNNPVENARRKVQPRLRRLAEKLIERLEDDTACFLYSDATLTDVDQARNLIDAFRSVSLARLIIVVADPDKAGTAMDIGDRVTLAWVKKLTPQNSANTFDLDSWPEMMKAVDAIEAVC